MVIQFIADSILILYGPLKLGHTIALHMWLPWCST